jgi:aspartyl-tRNA synthetase
MPSDEIRAVVSAEDPELVHRYIELHTERLQERLAARVRTLRRIERSMMNAMPERG